MGCGNVLLRTKLEPLSGNHRLQTLGFRALSDLLLLTTPARLRHCRINVEIPENLGHAEDEGYRKDPRDMRES